MSLTYIYIFFYSIFATKLSNCQKFTKMIKKMLNHWKLFSTHILYLYCTCILFLLLLLFMFAGKLVPIVIECRRADCKLSKKIDHLIISINVVVTTHCNLGHVTQNLQQFYKYFSRNTELCLTEI